MAFPYCIMDKWYFPLYMYAVTPDIYLGTNHYLHFAKENYETKNLNI